MWRKLKTQGDSGNVWNRWTHKEMGIKNRTNNHTLSCRDFTYSYTHTHEHSEEEKMTRSQDKWTQYSNLFLNDARQFAQDIIIEWNLMSYTFLVPYVIHWSNTISHWRQTDTLLTPRWSSSEQRAWKVAQIYDKMFLLLGCQESVRWREGGGRESRRGEGAKLEEGREGGRKILKV